MIVRRQIPLNTVRVAAGVLCFLLPLAGADSPATNTEIEQLKAMLASQQRQIDELRRELLQIEAKAAAGTVTVASTTPILPQAAAVASHATVTAFFATPVPAPLPQSQASVAGPTTDALQKAIDAINGNLRGFRISGDVRFRTDILYREANRDLPPGDNRAVPAQRARERYRVRLNVDKDLFFSEKADRPLAHAHIQLATDP